MLCWAVSVVGSLLSRLGQSQGWVCPRVPKSLRFLAYGWEGVMGTISSSFKMSRGCAWSRRSDHSWCRCCLYIVGSWAWKEKITQKLGAGAGSLLLGEAPSVPGEWGQWWSSTICSCCSSVTCHSEVILPLFFSPLHRRVLSCGASAWLLITSCRGTSLHI